MGDTEKMQGDVVTQTPSGNEGKTPETTKTLTPEVEALIVKANATLTNVGRIEAELRRSQSVAQAALSRLKEIEDENYRRQEDAAKDDPDELSRIQRRRQDAERQTKLEERETKVTTQLAKIMQVTAKALATQYNVSAETLLKYGGEDADSMDELAKSYGEKKAGESTAKSNVRMTQAPDDGKTKGGGPGLTKEDVSKMSPEERNRRTKEIAAMSF